MSRTIFIVAGVFSAPSLLRVDSAVKGTALLMLAAALAIILRRDSAATRHLVWLLAIVALLAVPVVSALLPQWRVLPEWAIGFCVLILRLMAARWILWNTERQGTVIGSSRQPTKATHDAIVTALEAASLQLGMCRPVTLLIHSGRTRPVVWGILRCRLLLPAAARHWSGEQLRSVFLHELAHIKRRDTTAQLLTQIACALYWFNPLVWFAAWRLGVESERACDDLVLASGVRPSAYAGHLLEVVTGLSPARWTQSCGLAMARKSSLEGRLVAVLSENLNRRGVSVALAAIALAIAVGIAVPIAMLRAADEKPGAPVQQQESQKPKDGAKLPGRLFVNAGLRTTKDETRLFQSAIAIDPNTGNWTRLRNLYESGFSLPLSPVRVSPDGRTMLFMQENEIWNCDAMTGENPARVFPKGQPKAWAPDGEEFIVVVEKEAGRPDSTENWRVSADGKKQSVLSLPIGEVVEDWSTDGRWLLGWSHADGQLYIMKPDGSGRRQLTHTSSKASRNEHPRFSPDGRRIVYLQTLYHGGDDAPDSRFSLRTINMDGTDDREILGETGAGPAPAKATWTAPMGARWSPDGKHFAVVLFDHTRDGGILAINGNWRLAIIDADGGNLRELKLEGVLNTVLPWEGPEWRPTAPGRLPGVESASPPPDTAPPSAKTQPESTPPSSKTGVAQTRPQPPAVVTREPRQGAKLQPGTAENLQWGEPVNGLRAALVMRPSPGEPKAGDMPDLYLVVQNVSKAPIRLSDTNTAPNVNLRVLYLKIDGKTQMGLGAREPALGDLMLQPREVAFLIMFSPDSKILDGHTTGSLIAEGTLKDTHQTMVAQMQIENAPAGAWTGKLVTGETSGAAAVGKPQPKDKEAQALFNLWQDNARGNGNIPGGLVGRLGDKVKKFIRNNTGDASGDPYAKKMAPLVPRFDAARDWTPADVVALLDDIAAITSIPLETTMDEAAERTFKPGVPLAPELANAPWGKPTAEGLRAARPLDPRAESYPVGMALRSRILLHNDGKEPLLLRAKSWMQPGHAARDAMGNPLHVESTYWTTLGRVQTWRLAPGEFCEIATPGLGVGKDAGRDEWADVRVGSWIDVADGVDVTLSPGSIDIDAVIEHGRASKPANGRELKLEIIRERLEREFPLPASAADREKVVRRVTKDIFGGEPTPDEISAFVTDKSDDPFTALGERLLRRAGLAAFVGELKPRTITFRTTPADADAASRPKVAIGPGRYTLDENVRLIIVGKPVAGRRTSDVEIRFWAADPNAEPPGKPYKIQVPDGFGTWAITCRPGTGVFWLMTQGAVRKIDYSNPAQVTETPIKPGSSEDMPGEFRDAVKRILTIYDIPAAEQEALLSKLAANAAPAPAAPKKQAQR